MKNYKARLKENFKIGENTDYGKLIKIKNNPFEGKVIAYYQSNDNVINEVYFKEFNYVFVEENFNTFEIVTTETIERENTGPYATTSTSKIEVYIKSNAKQEDAKKFIENYYMKSKYFSNKIIDIYFHTENRFSFIYESTIYIN